MSPGETLRSIMGISKPRFRRWYDMWECVATKGGARCRSIGTTPAEAWGCFRVLHRPSWAWPTKDIA